MLLSVIKRLIKFLATFYSFSPYFSLILHFSPVKPVSFLKDTSTFCSTATFTPMSLCKTHVDFFFYLSLILTPPSPLTHSSATVVNHDFCHSGVCRSGLESSTRPARSLAARAQLRDTVSHNGSCCVNYARPPWPPDPLSSSSSASPQRLP